MIKILHTGDVHLDSPFTLEDPSVSTARREELRESFRAMINHVRTNGIELCLIAGDLFEYEYATRETASFLATEFAKASDCRFVIAPGNHDYYSPGGLYAKTVFPDNVFIFREPTPSRFDFPELDCTVYGCAFTAPYMETNPMTGFRPTDPGRINILCMHADTSSPISKYCPFPEHDVFESGFDYAALGHIHNSRGIKHENDVYYAYCGSLEGRDYSECGYKGAIAGTIDKAGGRVSVSLRGIRFSRRRYADEPLNVTGAADAAEVSDALSKLIADNSFSDDSLLRVTLTGSVSLDLRVTRADLLPAASGLYSFELRDETVPLFDRDKLMRDNTIRGAFFRRLLPALEHGSREEREVASAALRYGLAALDGVDFVDF